MVKDHAYIQSLLQKYGDGNASERERQELFRYLYDHSLEEVAQPFIKARWAESVTSNSYTAEQLQHLADQVLARISNEEPLGNVVPIKRTSMLRAPWLRYAAAIVLVFGVAAYGWFHFNVTQTALQNAKSNELAILPGTDGAILTLADGRQVVLDSLGNGVIATQNGTKVWLKNGQLTYAINGNVPKEMAYNTMSTPKGRQFRVTLPDGTQVWLNAASSIRYPTVFTGNERRVEVTGEAYFEVAKNTKLPFRVNVNQLAEIEVLGTSFNVNAYENEINIKATLQDGSIRVLAGQMIHSESGLDQKTTHVDVPNRPEAILKPGEQAQIQVNKKTSPLRPDEIKVINDADIDKVLAWRNGLFNFNGLTFEEIMRQLERWYDIKVVYENKKVPNIRFGGKMTRGVSLNDLLKQLEKMGVHFKLDDRILRVLS